MSTCLQEDLAETWNLIPNRLNGHGRVVVRLWARIPSLIYGDARLKVVARLSVKMTSRPADISRGYHLSDSRSSWGGGAVSVSFSRGLLVNGDLASYTLWKASGQGWSRPVSQTQHRLLYYYYDYPNSFYVPHPKILKIVLHRSSVPFCALQMG